MDTAQYIIGKKLGYGASGEVFEAQDATTGQKVAIKVFTPAKGQMAECQQMEMLTLSWLDHPGIVKMLDQNTEVGMDKDGEEIVQSYLVTEYLGKGELYELIAKTGALSEPVARFVMKQIFDVVAFMHSRGVTHRDIKLENIMLDDDFNIKLIDFGFSAPILGKNGSGLLSTHLGTPGYIAPEILAGKDYKGVEVDAFSLGVLMFIILAQRPAFHSAAANDEVYNLIAKDQLVTFWKLQCKQSPKTFSLEAIKVISKLLQVDGSKRPSIQSILQSDWFKGPTADAAQVRKEFQQRFEYMSKST